MSRKDKVYVHEVSKLNLAKYMDPLMTNYARTDKEFKLKKFFKASIIPHSKF